MEKTSEISTPEARSAAEVVAALQRARKNLRIYPSNNPIYMRTVEEAYKKTMQFFEYADELVLKIQRNEFLLGDESIYTGVDNEENLALIFFRDGLRMITFTKDLDQDELLKFLLVLAADLDLEDVEEDLVTLLWEKDFINIKYKVDDSALVEDEGFQQESEEKALENPTTEGAMKEAFEAPPEEDETPLIKPMPISEEDMFKLEKQIETYGEGAVEKLIDILFDLLYASESLDELKRVVAVIQRAVEHSATENDLPGALNIFRRVKDIIKTSKSENVKKALSDVLSSASSKGMMKIIGDRLDAKEGIDTKEFKEYVGVLSISSIPNMVEMLGELKTIQGRKMTIKALTFVGKRDIPTLARGLKDSRWYVIRNIVLILRETKDKRALAFIVKAAGHEDPRVRKEVIKGISELGGVKYIKHLVEMLHDSDQSVSTASASVLGRLRTRVGLEALIERVTDKNLMEQDPLMIKKYFESMSYFKYDDVIDFLEDLLKKNPFFGRSSYNELKAQAIYCLGLIGDKRALPLLEELKGSKVKHISDYATTAINRIMHARKK
jgi:HEAT repeat protein